MAGDDKLRLDRDDPDHDFVDQSQIDFDPDDGLYSGTAVDGTSEIAGPHMDGETGELTGMDEVKQAAAENAEQAGSDDATQPRSDGATAQPGRHRHSGG